eukprot:Clim_evm9s150 gene=Clim_evmTU9s150
MTIAAKPALFRAALAHINLHVHGQVDEHETLAQLEEAVGVTSKHLVVLVEDKQLMDTGVHRLQDFLIRLYYLMFQVASRLDRPFMNCNIILPSVCGYDPVLVEDFQGLLVSNQEQQWVVDANAKREQEGLGPLAIFRITGLQEGSSLSISQGAVGPPSPLLEQLGNGDRTLRDSQAEGVCCGGTFDHLHGGHKVLLTIAALTATRRLVVGVSAEALLKNKKHGEFLEPLDRRIAKVRSFLEMVRSDITYEIVPIVEPMGPAGNDPNLHTIIVSKETAEGVNMINKHRIKLGLSELDSVVIDLVGPENDAAAKLSSTYLRKLCQQN